MTGEKLMENRRPPVQEPIFQVLDKFQIPVEVFATDGFLAYVNRAWLELNNISDPDLIVGKYNVLTDPVMAQMGLEERIRRVFNGELADFEQDFSAPIQDLVDRGVVNEKPFESAYMDIYMYPFRNEKNVAYVVCIFFVKNIYRGRPEVTRAMEYIGTHWHEKFNAEEVAKSLNISVSGLYSLFRQHTGMTLMEYYKIHKVEHLKEKLADKNLTIAEAFAACGEDSRSTYARVFKKITGQSPKEYRTSRV